LRSPRYRVTTDEALKAAAELASTGYINDRHMPDTGQLTVIDEAGAYQRLKGRWLNGRAIIDVAEVRAYCRQNSRASRPKHVSFQRQGTAEESGT